MVWSCIRKADHRNVGVTDGLDFEYLSPGGNLIESTINRFEKRENLCRFPDTRPGGKSGNVGNNDCRIWKQISNGFVVLFCHDLGVTTVCFSVVQKGSQHDFRRLVKRFGVTVDNPIRRVLYVVRENIVVQQHTVGILHETLPHRMRKERGNNGGTLDGCFHYLSLAHRHERVVGKEDESCHDENECKEDGVVAWRIGGKMIHGACTRIHCDGVHTIGCVHG
mmetsp:Transcript_23254/g.64482  ORF Transcript_23254/g.64482 Transcript_23254/m.64482 type:complete len:222 (+) Transcript_23254:2119-2784(+)